MYRENEHVSVPDEVQGFMVGGGEPQKEQKENNFEKTKKELEEFLNTYYSDQILKWVKEKEDFDVDMELFDFKAIQDELEQHIRSLFATGDKEEVISYITSLVLQDTYDNPIKPNIFMFRSFDDWEQLDKYAHVSDYMEDIVELNGQNNANIGAMDSERTYRSIYYQTVVNMLGEYMPETESHICDVLKHTDELESKKKEIERKTQMEGSVEDRIVWKDYESFDNNTYHERILKDDFTIGYGLGGIEVEDNILYEFTDVRNKIFNIFQEQKKDISDKSIVYLVERIKDFSYNLHENFYKYVDILNKNAVLASQELLKLLKTEKNPVTRALVTRALYHLEFGKIGMSEEGLKYLEKIFDLGEYNDPKYSAHRATGDGKVALFDEDHQAVGFFQLHSLDSDEKRLQAEVLQFGLDTLFVPKSDETDAERAEREVILAEFKEKYFETYLEGFYEETGVNFNNLDFREQGWFLWYVQHADEDEKKRVMAFVKDHREPGFKAFLSLEHDREMGNAILVIGEQLDRETAEKIFRVYGELVEVSEQADILLEEFFVDKLPAGLDTNKVTYEILKRGKDLLADFARDVQEKKVDNIIKKLNSIKSDIITFTSVFKTSFESGELNFEDVKGLDFESTQTLSDDDILKMEDIIRRNYEGSPLVEGVVKGFKGAIGNEENLFYTLKQDGNIISFDRFEKVHDEHGNFIGDVEFASFNTDPDYQRSSLGRAMMERTLDMQATQYDIVAEADPMSDICSYYVEQAGFDIVGYQEYKGSGVTVFEIKRDKGVKKDTTSIGEIVFLGDEQTVVERVKNYLDAGSTLVRYFRKGDEFFGVVAEREDVVEEKEVVNG